MHEIGINLYARSDISMPDYIRIIKDLGFTSVFSTLHDPAEMDETANLMAKAGLRYDTLHAPFRGINAIWHDGEEGDRVVADIARCADVCALLGAPTMVAHLSSGVNAPPPTDRGRARFADLVNYAAGKGVRVAFENTRKLANLAWAFEEFTDSAQVGFCWDTGHESCFTPGRQYMPLFGPRLSCLHIHDNLGVYNEDLHWLPFDGKIDFDRVAEQIRMSGFAGPLMLEVVGDRPRYQDMTAAAFLERAAAAAKRLRALVDEPRREEEKYEMVRDTL